MSGDQISSRIRRLIALAARTAESSGYAQFRHGAVLVRGGRLLNVASNNSKYTSFAARFLPAHIAATHHAELAALLNMPRTLTAGSDIYVVRINRSGELRNSKPCPMCQAAAKFCGVRRVFYTTDDGSVESMRL